MRGMDRAVRQGPPIPLEVADRAKGTRGGECNRTACKNPGARWYNRETRAYYCNPCKLKIDEGAQGLDLFSLDGPRDRAVRLDDAPTGAE
jgi:hypothetical protein